MPITNSADLRRLVRHSRKKISTSVHGLRPSGLYGRLVAPPVLLNSIPKAGTHLLESALNCFPLLRNAGRRTLSCWLDVPPGVLWAVRGIGKGAFLNAHLPYTVQLHEAVARRGTRVLLLIRDPRDVAVSHFKYVGGIDPTHRLYDDYKDMADDDERLMASILGIEGKKPSIGAVFEAFGEWAKHPCTLLCRFEDLIGPQGGGSRERQREVLARVAEHLGIPLAGRELDRIAAETFSARSSTFRQGKSGRWREYFKKPHIEAIKSVAGEHLLRFGYESDPDW